MLSSANRGAAILLGSIIGLVGALSAISSGGLIGLALMLLGPTLAVAIHELGHALAAHFVRVRVRTLAVGPLALRFNPTRIVLSGRALGPDVGGYVEHDEPHTRAQDRLIIAGGPLASLAAAVLPYALAHFLPTSADTIVRMLVSFAFMNLAAFVLSAWPFRLMSGLGNDGLQFLKTFDGGGRRKDWRFAKPKRSPWQAP